MQRNANIIIAKMQLYCKLILWALRGDNFPPLIYFNFPNYKVSSLVPANLSNIKLLGLSFSSTFLLLLFLLPLLPILYLLFLSYVS